MSLDSRVSIRGFKHEMEAVGYVCMRGAEFHTFR